MFLEAMPACPDAGWFLTCVTFGLMIVAVALVALWQRTAEQRDAFREDSESLVALEHFMEIFPTEQLVASHLKSLAIDVANASGWLIKAQQSSESLERIIACRKTSEETFRLFLVARDSAREAGFTVHQSWKGYLLPNSGVGSIYRTSSGIIVPISLTKKERELFENERRVQQLAVVAV